MQCMYGYVNLYIYIYTMHCIGLVANTLLVLLRESRLVNAEIKHVSCYADRSLRSPLPLTDNKARLCPLANDYGG